MTKYKAQKFSKTFYNAGKGFQIVLRSEKNLRIHCIMALLVLTGAYFCNCSATEYCLLIFAIAMVILSEMFNTAIEFTLDAVFHNRYSRMVGMAKDISAGTVMFASAIAVFIGLIIFGKYILLYFKF